MPKAGYACNGYWLTVLPDATAASEMADKGNLWTRVIQEYIKVIQEPKRESK